jgi:hypothetical protein
MLEPHEEILPEDVSEEDAERILKKLAAEIVSRRLTAPAIFFLESCRPLSFIGGQAMIVLEPFIMAVFDLPDYRKFALMMERRENVQKLITMIEDANQEQKLAVKEERKTKKRKRGRSVMG